MKTFDLTKSARMLWGGHWQVSLSRATGFSPEEIADMASGYREVPQLVRDALGEAYRDRIAGLQKGLSRLECC